MITHTSTMTPNGSGELHSLDLLSISQKTSEKCVYGSPFIAYSTGVKKWTVRQGWCHHWDCARCGQQRAREEYGRIVEGCRTLEQTQELYFITITCKGRQMSVNEAIKGYLTWTNRLLSALRADAKKRGGRWCYCQVTEWQKRGHPHSHFLTTYCPSDIRDGYKLREAVNSHGDTYYEEIACLRSDYLSSRIQAAGLGSQFDVSQVITVEGASRYVAKYLFKNTMFSAEYPKHWRRVRYSQSFPELPKRNSNGVALLSREDWELLSRKALVLECIGEVATGEARYYLGGADVFIVPRMDRLVDNATN